MMEITEKQREVILRRTHSGGLREKEYGYKWSVQWDAVYREFLKHYITVDIVEKVLAQERMKNCAAGLLFTIVMHPQVFRKGMNHEGVYSSGVEPSFMWSAYLNYRLEQTLTWTRVRTDAELLRVLWCGGKLFVEPGMANAYLMRQEESPAESIQIPGRFSPMCVSQLPLYIPPVEQDGNAPMGEHVKADHE